MKFFVAILLSAVAAINGAAIESQSEAISPFVIAPDSLFTSAWEYQQKLKELQQDINEQLTAIRTAVSTVLRTSSGTTLEQIESNAIGLMSISQPARDAIFDRELNSSPCVNRLRALVNEITEFTGFGSSNCVASYDNSLQGALKTAYALLQKYEGQFGDVQQVVVRSFIRGNVFLEADIIQGRFESNYESRSNEWAAVRPDVESFVSTLSDNVAVFNSVLGGCFGAIQNGVRPDFTKLQSEIATCVTFDNTADPFAMYR